MGGFYAVDNVCLFEILMATLLYNPLSPNIHIQILQSREYVEKSKNFIFLEVNIFLNSHNLFS